MNDTKIYVVLGINDTVEAVCASRELADKFNLVYWNKLATIHELTLIETEKDIYNDGDPQGV
jgi:hypothetical protein